VKIPEMTSATMKAEVSRRLSTLHLY